eukprot:39206-Chlamydomonas_euryale.AAC.1
MRVGVPLVAKEADRDWRGKGRSLTGACWRCFCRTGAWLQARFPPTYSHGSHSSRGRLRTTCAMRRVACVARHASCETYDAVACLTRHAKYKTKHAVACLTRHANYKSDHA